MDGAELAKFARQIAVAVDLAKIGKAPIVDATGQAGDLSEVQRFLRRYGYLDLDADVLPTQLDLATANALVRYQQFTGQAATGQFDGTTRSSMSCPRCALPDIHPLQFQTVGGWERRSLSFAFGHMTTQLATDEAQAAIVAAFTTWENAGRELSFHEVAVDEDPDIEIEWRPAADPDLSLRGGALAHADFPPGYSLLVDQPPLPLHFDDEEHRWTTDGSEYDLETVALHEIGHLLGLHHEPGNPDTVMFPNYEGERRRLHPDDVAGLHALYP